MLDTDTTYQMTPRPSAMGDLRFAGTIAAGLVAGTLGLGALAAPLVGWKDWPSALQSDATTQQVRLAAPQTPAERQRPANGPGSTQNVPGGQSAINVTGFPPTGAGTGTSTVAGGGTVTGLNVLVGGGSPTETSEIGSSKNRPFVSNPRGDDGDATAGDATATGEAYGGAGGFMQSDMTDTDTDGVANDVERANNLDPLNPADATATQPSGISKKTELRIKGVAGLNWDTNGNGIVDGDDDSDGDGVSNAVEERNGSDPTATDTDGDGIPDGMDDRDGDGYPDGLTIPSAAEPTVDAPPQTPDTVTQP